MPCIGNYAAKGGSIRLAIRTGHWSGRSDEREEHSTWKPRSSLRKGALGGVRQAARQRRVGRVQAPRPRADLPQVHLRLLRAPSRGARGRDSRPKSTTSTPRMTTSAPRSSRTATSTSPRTSSGFPKEARWDALLAAATQPDIGQRIDKALEAIEKANEEQLRGVLPRIYARAPLAAQKLGELVDDDRQGRLRRRRGQGARHPRPHLRVLHQGVRGAEGHRGGEFYTPRSVTRLLVEMLEPYEGRVLDPACGSCGLFVQSAEFIKSHGGRPARSRSTARRTTRPPGGSGG